MPLPTSSGSQTRSGSNRSRTPIVPATSFVRARPPVNYSRPSGGGAPSPPVSYSYSTPQYGFRPSVPSGPGPTPNIPRGPGGAPGGGPGGGGPKGGGGEPKQEEPKVPNVQKYLKSDEQYQQDRAALIKNYRNLLAQNEENRSNVKTDFGTTRSRLGEEQQNSLQAMRDDFAARGLYGGAEYLNEEQEFNEDYLNQFTDARTSRDRNIEQLLRELANAKTLQQENLAQARLEAIRRRAAEYGIK